MALFCGLAVAFCFVPGCIFALVYLIRLRRPWILRIYVVSAMVFTASLANILIYYGISDLVGYPELGRVENDKFFVGLDGKYRQVSGATYHRLVAYGQVTKAAVGYALVPFGILYAAVHLQAKWQSRRAFSERVEDHPRAGIRTKRQIDLDYAAPNQAGKVWFESPDEIAVRVARRVPRRGALAAVVAPAVFTGACVLVVVWVLGIRPAQILNAALGLARLLFTNAIGPVILVLWICGAVWASYKQVRSDRGVTRIRVGPGAILLRRSGLPATEFPRTALVAVREVTGADGQEVSCVELLLSGCGPVRVCEGCDPATVRRVAAALADMAGFEVRSDRELHEAEPLTGPT